MDSLNPENKLPNLKNEFAIFLCPQRPLTPLGSNQQVIAIKGRKYHCIHLRRFKGAKGGLRPIPGAKSSYLIYNQFRVPLHRP